MKEHVYQARIEWTGNKGSGMDNYKSYGREHNILIKNKRLIKCSSDSAFLGDATRHNPEDFLVSSLSSCHMLWYLHFCSVNKIIVEHYIDNAQGIMLEEKDGKGRFKEVVLKPYVIVQSQEMVELAIELHKKASEYCFIANSVNFPVKHKPQVKVIKDNI